MNTFIQAELRNKMLRRLVEMFRPLSLQSEQRSVVGVQEALRQSAQKHRAVFAQ